VPRQARGAHITKDYLAAVNDPEVPAICLATTQTLRVPVIRAAAEAGKPVYCEKPVANSLPELYEIQRIVNASRIPFCVGHNRRCAPAMIEGHHTINKNSSGHRVGFAVDGRRCMPVASQSWWKLDGKKIGVSLS
jgi:myo-inositol 2-dehydrogenase/D-chiro-inositol 1-dehydrogenase